MNDKRTTRDKIDVATNLDKPLSKPAGPAPAGEGKAGRGRRPAAAAAERKKVSSKSREAGRASKPREAGRASQPKDKAAPPPRGPTDAQRAPKPVGAPSEAMKSTSAAPPKRATAKPAPRDGTAKPAPRDGTATPASSRKPAQRKTRPTSASTRAAAKQPAKPAAVVRPGAVAALEAVVPTRQSEPAAAAPQVGTPTPAPPVATAQPAPQVATAQPAPQVGTAATATESGTATPAPQVVTAAPGLRAITLPSTITVRDLAGLLSTSPINLIRELMKNGLMANINQDIDFDTAAIVVGDLGFEAKEELAPEPVEEASIPPLRKRRQYSVQETAKLKPRPPVVTIMGHVDHGKTSLLDVIRQTNVVAMEVGGITQHIGAYQVEKQGKRITFLDTPGHEAFTAMRARGAMATDIAVLVVAADDGVQPQTVEAISHARAAQVPIIVALNKIDKPTADPAAVKRQLADAGLVVEDYGGEVICVPVSAKQKIGLETLLEMILLVAEMAELRANPEALAAGTVIEGRLDKTRGPMATLLVQDGTLHVGDFLVAGQLSGKIRAMFDDKGKRMDSAPPATPVAVLGLSDVPSAGETFRVVEGEHAARAEASAEASRRQEAAIQERPKVLSLDEFFAQAQAGQIKELNLILKADVQGSIEPIVSSVEKLGDETLHARFLHSGTGNIGESDIMLAIASRAIVIGFSVQVDPAASRMSDAEGVDVRVYDIIYKLADDIDKALKGMLEPTFKDVAIGHAEVRQVFTLSAKKRIAGCMVTDGVVARNALVRVKRGEQLLFEGSLASLRRFKDDVREVTAGMECGIGIEGFDNFAAGDVIESYRKEQVA